MLYSVVCIMYTIMTSDSNDANDFFFQVKHRLVERKLILLGDYPCYSELDIAIN